MEFYGIRRASMKERVRRANELEHEREEELVKMGKGTGEKGDCDEDEDDDDGEGGAGCFGGILGMFRTGRKDDDVCCVLHHEVDICITGNF